MANGISGGVVVHNPSGISGGVVPPINPRASGGPAASSRDTHIVKGQGAVVRFQPIKGRTPKAALDRRIWLPAILAPLQIDEDALQNTYDTLSAGQFSQMAQGPPTARRLRTGSLNAITMAFDPPWMTVTGQDPVFIRARLYEILRSKKPVHMLITWTFGGPAEFDGSVNFTSISKVVQPGEVDTRYLTIQISEFRAAEVARRGHGSGATGRKSGVSLPTTAVLKATDTLDSLSYEFYGTYAYWRFIRDANGIPVRFGAKTPLTRLGGHFRVGAKVKIPQLGSRFSSQQTAVA